MVESVKVLVSSDHNSCKSNTSVVVVGGCLEKVERFGFETVVSCDGEINDEGGGDRRWSDERGDT